MNDNAVATTAAYLNADEVKTFGSLTLPIPAHKRINTLTSQQKLGYNKKIFSGNEGHEIIPSGHDITLKTTKPPSINMKELKSAQKQNLMNGFSAANLVLDGKAQTPNSRVSSRNSRITTGDTTQTKNSNQNQNQTAVNTVDVGDFDTTENFLGIDTSQQPGGAGAGANNTNGIITNGNGNAPKVQTSSDQSLIELRNYASLMDQYSLHNFMIYNGNSLKSTPEFVSYHRIYRNEWGGIYR